MHATLLSSRPGPKPPSGPHRAVFARVHRTQSPSCLVQLNIRDACDVSFSFLAFQIRVPIFVSDQLVPLHYMTRDGFAIMHCTFGFSFPAGQLAGSASWFGQPFGRLVTELVSQLLKLLVGQWAARLPVSGWPSVPGPQVAP